ncbi:conserved hypothetical protein [Pyrobaculum islandicum DSM 4184]|uniref:Uncharacterized protein n=1 Tax=Pyrobaculum islandicum (strain DSM 4184 / JCM 9189 / GEO3) TaxID=384616 RepID=A1RT24_PYRIL|nr:hypothetical protein [Pyrobaculum islandicum]ABL88106.1 conserved hypothetical protein [Pyrobaculum islandicum DSM 4184]
MNASKLLLSITASPGVKALTITAGDKALAVHMYAKSSYVAVVTRNTECKIDDETLRKVAWLLVKLMDRVGKAVKSRYYTYTGPLEIKGDVIKYTPYISPTSTAEIVMSGGRAIVIVGEFRKKYRTGVEVAEILKKYIEYLEMC